MFPSKSLFDSTEMNRLFSPSLTNDAAPHYSLFQSPIANQSSSSADSVSPENFCDIPFQYHQDFRQRSRVTPSPNPTLSPFNDFFETSERNVMFTTSPQPYMPNMYESPRSYRSVEARPIVGRKILGTSQWKKEDNIDLFQDWTPPNSHTKTYELFPKTEERRDYVPPISPSMLRSMPPRPPSIRSNYSNMTQSTNSFRRPQSSQSQGQICTFCRKNGERPAVYETHCLKEKIGAKYVVSCPILRSHVCRQCGVSGDDAHTITYCPVLRINNNGMPLVSTTVKLKNTPIKSNGKRRYNGQVTRMQ